MILSAAAMGLPQLFILPQPHCGVFCVLTHSEMGKAEYKEANPAAGSTHERTKYYEIEKDASKSLPLEGKVAREAGRMRC